jgi:hypothetical protein
MFFRNVDTRSCFRCCLHDDANTTKSGRSGGRGSSGTDGGGKVGITYEWGWVRCLIYIKSVDTFIGAWMLMALWRAMTMANVSCS